MPSLLPLYRAAVFRRGDARTPTLPERTLSVEGITVDRAHLAAYNRVGGFRQRDELPATYPHVLTFPLAMALMTAPDFPFRVVGLVHVANRATVLQPMSCDAVFACHVRAEALRPHDRGTQLDIVTSMTADGSPVWEERSTYLRRGSVSGGSPTAAAAPPSADAVWRVPRRTGPGYAAVSGDRNPIHTSRLLAKAFGFPRTIAHGMWTKARCLAALEGRLPDTYTVDVAFKLPILLPATVAFTATGAGAAWSFGVRDARSGKPHLTGHVG